MPTPNDVQPLTEHMPPDLLALTGLIACAVIIAICGYVLSPWVRYKLDQRRRRREHRRNRRGTKHMGR